MSDTINPKDVINNAKRMMREKDYEQAIKNWQYVKKNQDEFDPYVNWNIAK